MRRAKRNAAKLLSAAMAVGMMAGMAVPAAAEEESTNIWASDVDIRDRRHLGGVAELPRRGHPDAGAELGQYYQ